MVKHEPPPRNSTRLSGRSRSSRRSRRAKIGTNADPERKASRGIILRLLQDGDLSPKQVNRLKCVFSKKHHLPGTIKNATVLEHATEEERARLAPLLRRKSTRTLAGVAVVAVMTKPIPCPGRCIYCPGRASQPGKPVAQSYTGREPAAMRSLMYDYDAYEQVSHRIADLEAIGHQVDKIEIICMGGTLPAADEAYQDEFVHGCLDGVLARRTPSIAAAKRAAETAPRRLVGLTFETRPDFCTPVHLNRMLDYGATRVEIGVQTVYDDVYEFVCRGHDTSASIDAIRYAKDAGLKVNAHVMPNLPGATLERDRAMFRELFANPDYRPDMLKIYPTLILKGTRLYEMWQRGEYAPYSLNETIQLLGEAKAHLPPYVRIQRIQRDIPAPLIQAGVTKSNLRQLVKTYMAKQGLRCQCIRCREHGFRKHLEDLARRKGASSSGSRVVTGAGAGASASADAGAPHLEDLPLQRYAYEASSGEELFISLETADPEVLFGFLRLRVPSARSFRPEIPPDTSAILREIRVVGELVPHASDPARGQIQHRGLGSRLLREAERVTFEERGLEKLVVISGVGVRPWFFERGYHRDGPYVSKNA